MLGFDVLDPLLDLRRSYFLEASAGTGKTFTIENIVVRLLQEGLEIDQILVVTFTRAATLELKMRIRRNLEEKKLTKALLAFETAKIFTIHGFCFHTLTEYAFETGFPLNQEEESATPETLKKIFRDFLRTELTDEEIHPKQLEKVLKRSHYDLEKVFRELTSHHSVPGRSFQEIALEINDEMQKISIDKEEMLALAPLFGGMCDRKKNLKPEIIEGIMRGDLIDSPLTKMIPENLLRNRTYPEMLLSLNERLIPLLNEVSDVHAIMGRLRERAQTFITHICAQEDLFFYDDLLKHMQKNIRNPLLAEKMRAHYKAVLIDEFQDTDGIQWEIFSTLFLGHLPLYLVGDPKQSIYAFRGADLYAYMEAKKRLGEETHATLTRNFRSQPSLIEALNALFSRAPDLISLPKTGETLSVPPILSALPETCKGEIVFCDAADESTLFSFIVQEIERLHRRENIPYQGCAVLVKDRHQAKRFCAHCSLPFSLRKTESLLDSDALPVLEDLLIALLNPREWSSVAKALGGPLFCYPLEDLGTPLETQIESFYRYHHLLMTEGILSLFQTLKEEVGFPTEPLYLDLLQLVELLAEKTPSAEDFLPFLQKLKQEDPDSEIVKARAKWSEDAIQVLTLHVSKGLEFDVVFPIALIASVEMKEEEDLSEKMRQLYVAFTRAKKRLYLPLSDKENTPMHVFLSKVLKGESPASFARNHPHFSFTTCPLENPPKRIVQPAPLPLPKQQIPLFPTSTIQSFSSLAEKKQHHLPHLLSEGEMPTGSITGILLHSIFERLDFSLTGSELRTFLSTQLKGTHLEPWLTKIERLINNTLHTPLPAPTDSFCLADVDPKKMVREMEFIYPTEKGYLKGFVDLFFEYQDRYYIVDWKSNALENYSPEKLHEAMLFHEYLLQAELYETAAQKYLKLFNKDNNFAGSFYMFLRGLEEGNGIYYFYSEKK